jgi:hypothetical protein
MAKKKCNSKTESPEFTPLKTERMWAVIKDISAQRIKELDSTPTQSTYLTVLADQAKDEFLTSLIPALTKRGEVTAEDILSVLTLMGLSLANEMFEQNDEIMKVLNMPDEDDMVGMPYTSSDGAPRYV